jgi:hypothetical protein
VSFTLCHAAGDVYMKTARRRGVYTNASRHGDVLTFSEANKDHAAVRALRGFSTALVSELAICWRTSKFTRIDQGARLVMVGGHRGRLGSRRDHRRRGPNRYVLWVVLRENATGVEWLISTHHAIAKSDTKAKWRRTLRAQGFRNTAAELRRAQKKHPKALLVATGDWNTRGKVNLGLGLTEARTPATFGRSLRYDRVQHTGASRVTGITTIRTGGDHRGVVARLGGIGHATPPPKPTHIPPHPAPKPTPKPQPKPPEVHMPRQAHSLDVLLAEVNKLAPHRSKASDGGLGDQAHASRVSDHNPNAAGVWRARDVTHDPKHGCDADVLAASVAAKLGKHPALGPGAYVIRNRRIISTNRLHEGWRPYTGSNPHVKHVHVSVATAAAGYDSTKPWSIQVAPAPELNPTQRARAKILAGLNQVDAGLDDIAADVADTRKVVHTRAGEMRRSNAHTRGIYREGPSK